MKLQKRFLGFMTAMTMVLTIALPINVFANEGNENTTIIDVLSINDFHGSLVPSSETDKNIGAAKLVQVIKEKKAANPNTLVVSAGDNFNGSAMSNLLYGEPVSIMLKNSGIVASAIGNHEYDWGEDKFAGWSKAMGAPFLAANIFDEETQEVVDYAEPYIIQQVAGVKIGFIGLTTQETAYKTKLENIKHLEFRDPIKTAQEYVPILKEEGADIIILLTHIGTFQDDKGKITFEPGMEGLTKVEGVDAIISGHSHKGVAGKLNGMPIVQAIYNGRGLGTLKFEVNKDTKELISVKPQLDTLFENKDEIAENNAMKYTLNAYNAKVGPILSEILGQNTGDLTHDRTQGLSQLGQWTAEVMQAASEADISVTNGGGVRKSLEQGNITMADLYEVMPFDNVLSTFNMTGAKVKEMFEHGIANEQYGWIQYSGIIIEYNPNAPQGNKVAGMKLEDGTEVEMDKVYSVVTNDFMGTGGDAFSMFPQSEHIADTVAIRDLMVDSIREQGTINYKPIDRFIEVDTAGTTTSDVPEDEVADAA